jgi:hypothetical protein
MEFFQKLLAGYQQWDTGQWSLAVAAFAFIAYLLEKALHIFSRMHRYVFPPKLAPIPYYQVPNPEQPTPQPPALPQIHQISAAPPTTQVIGREDELLELRQHLLSTGGVKITNAGTIVQGHGGIGKSTLARYYVDKHGDEYGGILWARAAEQGKLAEDLAALAPALDLPPNTLKPLQCAQAVLAHIGADSRKWLLIYDNVTDLDTIKGLLPNSAHLIVTTREATGWDGFATLRATTLGYDTIDAPAVTLLMQTADRDTDHAGARDLAEALGGLPLALIMAGALVRAEGYEFADYQTRIADVINHAPKNIAYPDSVIGAVQLSYDGLPKDAKPIADILAWFAAEGLDAALLTDAPGGAFWEAATVDIPESVQALIADPSAVAKAMQALVDASLLIRKGRADGPHDMHRMTAAALRALQETREDPAAAYSATAILAAQYPNPLSLHLDVCRRLTPHVLALW